MHARPPCALEGDLLVGLAYSELCSRHIFEQVRTFE